MAKITDITIQKNKNRANIFLDGKFVCGLERETIIKSGLKIDDQIEKSELENIQLESESKRCFEAALKLLERKPYSVSKIKTKLKEKGYMDLSIDECVAKLKDYHYIDDDTLATTIVNSFKNKSKREIEQKLFSYGIYGKAKENALSLLDQKSDEYACNIAAAKHAKNKEKNNENMSKTIKFLVNKGFSFEQAKKSAKSVYNLEVDFYD